MKYTSIFVVAVCILVVGIAQNVSMADAIATYCNNVQSCIDLQPDPISDISYYSDTLAQASWISFNTDYDDENYTCPYSFFNDPDDNEICDYYASKTRITNSCRTISAAVCQLNGISVPACCPSS